MGGGRTTLPMLTLALESGGWSGPRSGRFTPQIRDLFSIVQKGGWASWPHGISNPEPSNTYRVAIPTALPRPLILPVIGLINLRNC